MKNIKQYKIIYPDSFNKNPLFIEPADFWWFSCKDVERYSSETSGKNGNISLGSTKKSEASNKIYNIDFSLLKELYPNEVKVIDRIKYLYNDDAIKRLQRQFDAMLKHLCNYTPEKRSKNKDLNDMPSEEETGTQKAINDYIKKREKIRREQSKEDYHQLRSLFRIKFDNHEQYAFRLFSLYDESRESSYYPLPFGGSKAYYSIAVYNTLSCIVNLIDIFHWGYVPFCIGNIKKYLFYLMSPLASVDPTEDTNNNNKQTTFRVKTTEERESDQQLIADILEWHWSNSSLFTYPRAYNNFLTAFKGFIKEYRSKNSSSEKKQLVLSQITTLKELYSTIEEPNELSPSLFELNNPLNTIIEDIKFAPGSLAIVEGIFKEEVYSRFEILYDRLFIFMRWIKENKEQLPVWTEMISQGSKSINDYASDFKQYYINFESREHHLIESIPDKELLEERSASNLAYYANFPHIHYGMMPEDFG